MKTLELSNATALVSVQDIDGETISPQFIALIEQSRARQAAEGGVSSGEIRRRLGHD